MAHDRALLKVLELRKKQEDEACSKWAESERQLKVFADQLQKLSSFRDLYIGELNSNSTKANFGMQQYLAYQGFIERLDQTYERQSKLYANMQEKSALLKEQYLRCHQERQVIEALLEKHRQQILKAQAKAEAKFNDELVSAKQARILIAQNMKQH